MSVFIQEFSGRGDIISRYGGTSEEDLKDATIHLAWYGYGDYCGASLVIYEKDGKLYEVNASHCSCYGLEGQWEPEETSWKAISTRSWYGSCDGAKEAEEAAQRLQQEHNGRS